MNILVAYTLCMVMVYVCQTILLEFKLHLVWQFGRSLV